MDYEVNITKWHSKAVDVLSLHFIKIVFVTFLMVVLTIVLDVLAIYLILGIQSLTKLSYNINVIIALAVILIMQSVIEILRAGQRIYVLDITAGQSVTVGKLFSGVRRSFRFIGCYLWILMWVLIWSLLFIVPGIIKALSYSMTPYLVAEYDDLSIRQAMYISKQLTRGHRSELCSMYVLLLGYGIIAYILLLIGVFLPWVALGGMVYIVLWWVPLWVLWETMVYRRLKSIAIDQGLIINHDVNLLRKEEAYA